MAPLPFPRPHDLDLFSTNIPGIPFPHRPSPFNRPARDPLVRPLCPGSCRLVAHEARAARPGPLDEEQVFDLTFYAALGS